MVARRVLAGAAFVAGAAAQVAQFTSGSYGISVNVPSDTASSGSGSLFVQISAPSGTSWIGFGQGTRMAGANMLVVYAADSTNVTVSPRLGTGESEPQLRSDASVALLEGSGIASDGSLVANIRCDSCLSWSGGSLDPPSSSSNWIWAHKSGDPLDSTDQSATISQHGNSDFGTFTLDLTQGTGGSSSNPFVAASDSSPSQSASESGSGSTPQTTSAGDSGSPSTTATGTGSTSTASATSTGGGGVSAPLASSNPSSSSGSSSKIPLDGTRVGHATIMSLVFVLFFPLSALTLYLPVTNKVRYIHAPLQAVSIVLMIIGLALGIKLGNRIEYLDGYHMVIGYLLVAWMAVFQPALGILQHLHFRKQGTRSGYGHGHRWMGRAVLALGIVNGGLGFKITGDVGSIYVPTYSVVVYSIFAVLVSIVYLAVIFWPRGTQTDGNGFPVEKRPRTDGYEMNGRSSDGRPL